MYAIHWAREKTSWVELRSYLFICLFICPSRKQLPSRMRKTGWWDVCVRRLAFRVGHLRSLHKMVFLRGLLFLVHQLQTEGHSVRSPEVSVASLKSRMSVWGRWGRETGCWNGAVETWGQKLDEAGTSQSKDLTASTGVKVGAGSSYSKGVSEVMLYSGTSGTT